jgi:hypothetical protein
MTMPNDEIIPTQRRLAVEVAAALHKAGNLALIADTEALRRSLVYLRRALLELGDHHRGGF